MGSAARSQIRSHAPEQVILGVDPGLTRCGFGIVRMRADRRAEWVHHEVQGTGADEPLEQRILRIAQAADQLLERFAPDALAIERVFAQNNAPTVVGTAQASGVVIAAAAARGVPVAWHTPSEVKAAVTGDGSAEKAAVTKMIARILRLEDLPRPADAADALAIAVCHGWRSGVGAGLDAQAATTTTHQGARTGLQRAARERGAVLTPAQRAWQAAEQKARRGR
ncbi:crossover junction endodeoxyribonuclease RuvC [Kocuria sp. p3-SID1433]|uniref:crossover junction endodeoxyribonuclease RuvC n=1 Tax=unclassified Kocuria TaxID=2649579 RepID=UPI0021A68F44|nr:MULTISPECIES: crossover junction endodeoxyribonuclease RuvC [unclassified Kocuria]MCT1600778.1 crossover junction endodeoxyribonuclease RuvC [Kocuria sp. p3-SID1428]MCT2179013.1 crossover junction endodeoxyribonuclease RuvC [Kocuria sp. p3-SID1433]